ncbi:MULTISPECIES: hypothetical protein [Achromobacter]|uniref:Uncharacterized protein n=2 Tax=Achromobacter piechaudii TaxID=72556 RepID=A0A6S7EKU5_9BURK|nr:MULTISPECIES: hypothetical protein [Achromobacter]EFF75936.1 hypothetical protein HMPREF0004_2662 [Achromobacter piechaudii ATCC 43553]KNY10694.1 hypothetical protein AKG08_13500 [Achromobacter piechaudii]MPS79217.1 hypothetical protein [Achromobacter sp.]CAB3727975.1 hypothetical protein LMG1873_04539 [Achromobacter piechaudii]CAB3903482.1 hypothetical protein LMG2828_04624 [Achromobacter piechaudii]
MGTELDGRLLAMRQAVAIAIALSTRSSPQATDMALELLNDLKAGMDSAPSDSPFEKPEWVEGAQDELDGIARLVRAFTKEA